MFVILLLLTILPRYSTVHAEAWFSNTIESFNSAIKDAEGGTVLKEGYDTATTTNNQLILTCQIMGCSKDPGSVFYYKKSTLSSVARFISAIYTNPPAKTSYFIADAAQSLGFIPKQAYAQGIGFSGLTALLPLWKVFRNIAYSLLAVIMLVIGFMVMLRKKIDPKTVVTVQNALPRIVVTLLLITFSYAIVGLVIDLMYFVIILFITTIGSAGMHGVDTAKLISAYTTGGLGKLFAGTFSLFSAFSKDILNPLPEILSGDILEGLSELAGTLTQVNSLILLVLSIAFLFAFVRILFMLLSAYINIIISVIVGPLQILTDAIPGATGFSSWLKNLFSNIIVFPVTASLLVLGGIINDNIGTEHIWTPPLIPTGSDSLAKVLIGLGLILTIPTIVGSIKEAIKVKPVLQAGPGAVFGPIMTGGQTAMQLWYQGSFIGQTLKRGKEDPSRLQTLMKKEK